MRRMTDSEITAVHPRVDVLKLLLQSDWNPYRLTKELGLTYRACYLHLKALEESGLIGGRLKYHITEKGRQVLRSLSGSD